MEFPLAKFRLRYPRYTSYSDEIVLDAADQSWKFASDSCPCCQEDLWMLVTAHRLFLRQQDEQGNNAPGQVASASVGGVNVSFSVLASKNDWDAWFKLSPYGQEYLATSKSCSAGGTYVGGFPETAAYRKVGGLRSRRGRL